MTLTFFLFLNTCSILAIQINVDIHGGESDIFIDDFEQVFLN